MESIHKTKQGNWTGSLVVPLGEYPSKEELLKDKQNILWELEEVTHKRRFNSLLKEFTKTPRARAHAAIRLYTKYKVNCGLIAKILNMSQWQLNCILGKNTHRKGNGKRGRPKGFKPRVCVSYLSNYKDLFCDLKNYVSTQITREAKELENKIKSL